VTSPGSDDPAPARVLERLIRVIRDRAAGIGTTRADGRSYVRTLLDGGPEAIRRKLEEEAAELGHAVTTESDARVCEEAADLVFHLLVALVHRNLGLDDVEAVLAARFGTSGIDEKAARPPGGATR
jgi:phosphoribosyl-ATP pyrophosphohydrolase